jgi:hypothetical protein
MSGRTRRGQRVGPHPAGPRRETPWESSHCDPTRDAAARHAPSPAKLERGNENEAAPTASAKKATRPPSDQPDGLLSLRCVAVSLRARSPSLACLAVPRDARASMKRGALPLCRANDLRPPKHTSAMTRIKQRCCPIGKVAQRELGRAEERPPTFLRGVFGRNYRAYVVTQLAVM